MSTRGHHAQRLGQLPWFTRLGRRDLRSIARLVDDIVVPAGFGIGRSDRQVLLVVDGAVETETGAVRGPGAIVTDTAVRTCTPARLLVIHRNARAAVARLAPAFDASITSVASAREASARPIPSGPARLSA